MPSLKQSFFLILLCLLAFNQCSKVSTEIPKTYNFSRLESPLVYGKVIHGQSNPSLQGSLVLIRKSDGLQKKIVFHSSYKSYSSTEDEFMLSLPKGEWKVTQIIFTTSESGSSKINQNTNHFKLNDGGNTELFKKKVKKRRINLPPSTPLLLNENKLFYLGTWVTKNGKIKQVLDQKQAHDKKLLHQYHFFDVKNTQNATPAFIK